MTDLRIALRHLRATPVITLVAVLSLALGIGANTAIFSLINSLIVRPLPIADPQRLVIVSDTRARTGVAGWTYGVWDAMGPYLNQFDRSAAWFSERLNLAEGGGPLEPTDAIWVTGRYFDTLGVPALLGRTITARDDTRTSADGPVAVISYRLWQSRFGGDAGVVGRRLVVERVPFTIVGVTPPSFFGSEVGRSFDVALPMNTEPLIAGRPSRIDRGSGFYALTVLLRLKPAQTIDQATALLRGVQGQIRQAAMPPTMPARFQAEFMKEPLVAVAAGTGTSNLREQFQEPLVFLMAVVALVLLIACANIANLQIARTVARRHDVSVRLALGAARWRVIRETLIESLLLSAAGAALALVFAAWSSRFIVSRLAAARQQVYLDLSLDWRVLLFTATVAIVTTMLSGLLPAVRAGRGTPIDALKERNRATDPRAGRVASSLIVAQVALSLVIVVAAGLFVQTFQRLANGPHGFDGNRVLLVNLNLVRTSVAPDQRVEFVRQLVDDVAGLPGAGTVSASMVTPIQGFGIVDLVRVPGGPTSMVPMQGGRLGERSTFANSITPGWFATYGMPLKAGRDFTRADMQTPSAVIVVNEAFAGKFLRGRDPVGATVSFDGPAGPIVKTVVGVVGDAAYNSMREQGEQGVPIEYLPLAQGQIPPRVNDMTISVRAASGSPTLLVRAITDTLTAADRDLVFSFRTMSDQIDASLVQDQLIALLSGFFGALALLLAGLGLYGMTAYAVACRRGEIGIRMALGSTRARVLRFVLSRAAGVVLAGVAIGVGLSLWASRFVTTLLFGIEPRDVPTLAVAALTLTVLALAATWLPAFRASRLDPASVLRAD
jgi:predicted permease